jgi:hypothetical protein
MSLVTWKDLCVDVVDLHSSATFWAGLLGLRVVPDEGEAGERGEVHLEGPTPGHTVWPCVVPEPKTVKDRVHLDVHAAEPVPAGTTRLSAEGEHPWTVVAGPEGDEICTFVRDEVPDYRLYEVAVDVGEDHRGAAAWWQQVWGGRVGTDDEHAFSWVEQVPGMPFESLVFCAVPEPKTVKNRIHWDVTLGPGAEVEHLVELGATVLRRPDDEIAWTVLADPEGNEFCVFERADA